MSILHEGSFAFYYYEIMSSLEREKKIKIITIHLITVDNVAELGIQEWLVGGGGGCVCVCD